MASLIAQGPDAHDRWRRSLPAGQVVSLGRSAAFATPWDARISRKHAELQLAGDVLHVRQSSDARNAIFFQGRQVEDFQLNVGEHFVIGDTTFALVDDHVEFANAARPLREEAFSGQYLRGLQYRTPQARIHLLGQLPDLIQGTADDRELMAHAVQLLLAGVPTAEAVAVVRWRTSPEESSPDPSLRDASVEILHWDNRRDYEGGFRPSQQLIRAAVSRAESVLHVWNYADRPAAFTAQEGVDWAFCTPITGEACPGWGFYVSGRQIAVEAGASLVADSSDLADDLKFTEVVAATLGSLRELNRLQTRQAQLRQFFSPVVIDLLAQDDPDVVLAPREAELSVLFCDLRGFVRASEQSAADLMGHLGRVSEMLSLTTREILGERGVVGDFHGDAVMGFWGWPLAQADAANRACRAALAVVRHWRQYAGPADESTCIPMGFGIASGRAVAGKIGAADQVKVTAFGPVVNLASRLEGMTRLFRVSVLLDEQTAQAINDSPALSDFCVRRLANLQPAGMQSVVEVCELIDMSTDSALASGKEIWTGAAVAAYQEALDSFIAGDWSRASESLQRSSPDDGAAQYLLTYIRQHGGAAPPDWDGVIRLKEK